MRRRMVAVLAVAFLVAAAGGPSAWGDVKLPALLGSSMVLQQGKPIPIWGTADPGEEVTVALHKTTVTAQVVPKPKGPGPVHIRMALDATVASTKATADAHGKWMARLKPQEAGGPYRLVVAGKNTIELANVLIGEAWVCSGQSNMAMTVRGCYHAAKDIAAAEYPKIRLFTVNRKVATEPQADCESRSGWLECSPKSVGGFSAVGYFFGRKLHQELKVPVGLIHSSWGGTPAEAWTPRSFLESNEVLKPILERWAPVIENYPKALEAHKQQLAQRQALADKIRADNQAAAAAWAKKVAQAQAQAKAEGRPYVPPKGKPRPKRTPRPPRPPRGPNHPHFPSGLYNAMIHPLVPFAIQGAIWYQGESNAGRAYQYRTLFSTMIQSWRKAWGDELHFHTVQLASYMAVVPQPSGSTAWAELREAQTMSLRLPHTAMACIIDIGEARDIHPKNKQDVGLRLALAALKATYGKDVPFSGPTYDSMAVEGRAVRIKFKHTFGGLVAKPFCDPVTPNGPPLTKRFGIPLGTPPAPKGKARPKAKRAPAPPPVATTVPVDGSEQPLVIPRPESQVYGFAIAGDDKQFVWAEAKIAGDDTVVVSSPAVAKPVAVRYAWENTPICNLYNQAGLPAVPFRTDAWPGVTDKNR